MTPAACFGLHRTRSGAAVGGIILQGAARRLLSVSAGFNHSSALIREAFVVISL